MYAIVKIKGKQYKAEKGRWILVPRMDGKEGEKVDFEEVLIYHDGKKANVGAPYVKDVKVNGTVIDPLIKDRKVIVFKYKRRKDYRKKQGHRQQFTKVMIENISKSKGVTEDGA